ncbi:hypothetical protein [Saccharopolyspora taberi]|uniref:hypothetical protein n=1 Tax=Saccharopolyspora taberi TaxID=60895 RepID=UPI0031D1F440
MIISPDAVAVARRHHGGAQMQLRSDTEGAGIARLDPDQRPIQQSQASREVAVLEEMRGPVPIGNRHAQRISGCGRQHDVTFGRGGRQVGMPEPAAHGRGQAVRVMQHSARLLAGRRYGCRVRDQGEEVVEGFREQ